MTQSTMPMQAAKKDACEREINEMFQHPVVSERERDEKGGRGRTHW